MLRGKLRLSLVLPKLHVLPARDTEPAQAHLGLLAERQLRQTPLDTFQGQHESGGSTDPRMEWRPRSLMGQSQVCRESARTPSLPMCGAEDGKEQDAEDTPMAS